MSRCSTATMTRGHFDHGKSMEPHYEDVEFGLVDHLAMLLRAVAQAAAKSKVHDRLAAFQQDDSAVSGI